MMGARRMLQLVALGLGLLLVLSPALGSPLPKQQERVWLDKLPEKIDFSCKGRRSGYYADIETGCQMYHMCDPQSRRYSYLCPALTMFSQFYMTCVQHTRVNCSMSEKFYHMNEMIGQKDMPFHTLHEVHDHEGIRVEDADDSRADEDEGGDDDIELVSLGMPEEENLILPEGKHQLLFDVETKLEVPIKKSRLQTRPLRQRKPLAPVPPRTPKKAAANTTTVRPMTSSSTTAATVGARSGSNVSNSSSTAAPKSTTPAPKTGQTARTRRPLRLLPRKRLEPPGAPLSLSVFASYGRRLDGPRNDSRLQPAAERPGRQNSTEKSAGTAGKATPPPQPNSLPRNTYRTLGAPGSFVFGTTVSLTDRFLLQDRANALRRKPDRLRTQAEESKSSSVKVAGNKTSDAGGKMTDRTSTQAPVRRVTLPPISSSVSPSDGSKKTDSAATSTTGSASPRTAPAPTTSTTASTTSVTTATAKTPATSITTAKPVKPSARTTTQGATTATRTTAKTTSSPRLGTTTTTTTTTASTTPLTTKKRVTEQSGTTSTTSLPTRFPPRTTAAVQTDTIAANNVTITSPSAAKDTVRKGSQAKATSTTATQRTTRKPTAATPTTAKSAATSRLTSAPPSTTTRSSMTRAPTTWKATTTETSTTSRKTTTEPSTTLENTTEELSTAKPTTTSSTSTSTTTKRPTTSQPATTQSTTTRRLTTSASTQRLPTTSSSTTTVHPATSETTTANSFTKAKPLAPSSAESTTTDATVQTVTTPAVPEFGRRLPPTAAVVLEPEEEAADSEPDTNSVTYKLSGEDPFSALELSLSIEPPDFALRSDGVHEVKRVRVKGKLITEEMARRKLMVEKMKPVYFPSLKVPSRLLPPLLSVGEKEPSGGRTTRIVFPLPFPVPESRVPAFITSLAPPPPPGGPPEPAAAANNTAIPDNSTAAVASSTAGANSTTTAASPDPPDVKHKKFHPDQHSLTMKFDKAKSMLHKMHAIDDSHKHEKCHPCMKSFIKDFERCLPCVVIR